VLFKASKSQKTDILLTLFAVLFMSMYLYGLRILFMTGFTVLVAVVFDYLCMRFLGKKKGERLSLEPVMTAMIFTFCLSPLTPYWVCIYGMLIALFVAKLPFGGTGKNIFNPAAAGLAFVLISFPDQLSRYPAPYTQLPLFGPLDAVALQASPGAILQAGGNPAINTMNAMLGNYSGPIGATAIFVLGACAFYLLVRRSVSWRILFSVILSFTLAACIFQRSSTDWFHSAVYELVSGAFLFVAVFMTSDPVTSPKNGWGQVLFGVTIGVGSIVIRWFGASEVSAVFPLLLANALVPAYDRVGAAIKVRLVQQKNAAEPTLPAPETEVASDE